MKKGIFTKPVWLVVSTGGGPPNALPDIYGSWDLAVAGLHGLRSKFPYAPTIDEPDRLSYTLGWDETTIGWRIAQSTILVEE